MTADTMKLVREALEAADKTANHWRFDGTSFPDKKHIDGCPACLIESALRALSAEAQQPDAEALRKLLAEALDVMGGGPGRRCTIQHERGGDYCRCTEKARESIMPRMQAALTPKESSNG